jgi:hypothetical protein
MKRTDFQRCPIHGTRVKGGPDTYQCARDGGHVVRLPSLEQDVVDWPAMCDGCGLKKSVTAISDWLSSDAHLDFHLCPRCEKRVSGQLLHMAVGPAFPRFLTLMARRRARKAT